MLTESSRTDQRQDLQQALGRLGRVDAVILLLVISLAVFYWFSMRDEDRMLDERFPRP
jgi:hypothetical protein